MVCVGLFRVILEGDVGIGGRGHCGRCCRSNSLDGQVSGASDNGFG
ncbi:hypothetical protein [Pasteuria penetrans]|nr:hypothetical protein [Pasteuria penetrans]